MVLAMRSVDELPTSCWARHSKPTSHVPYGGSTADVSARSRVHSRVHGRPRRPSVEEKWIRWNILEESTPGPSTMRLAFDSVGAMQDHLGHIGVAASKRTWHMICPTSASNGFVVHGASDVGLVLPCDSFNVASSCGLCGAGCLDLAELEPGRPRQEEALAWRSWCFRMPLYLRQDPAIQSLLSSYRRAIAEEEEGRRRKKKKKSRSSSLATVASTSTTTTKTETIIPSHLPQQTPIWDWQSRLRRLYPRVALQSSAIAATAIVVLAAGASPLNGTNDQSVSSIIDDIKKNSPP